MICPLCSPSGEKVVFKDDLFRVIYVEDEDYPGYFRLILNVHCKEMSELWKNEQQRIVVALTAIEKVMIAQMKPDKVNWAQLGNNIPHLHWHIIARFKDDKTFPGSIWAAPRRETDKEILKQRKAQAELCCKILSKELSANL